MLVKWYLDIDKKSINYGFIFRQTNEQVFVYGVKKTKRKTKKERLLNIILVKTERAGEALKKNV